MRVADLIVECLEQHGIERVYCVPGESYLALLDALHDSSIRTIVCRHESGAGFMAVNEGKITGRPGVVMVSRGPGATNASIAVHVAEQDAAPLIMFVGQVSRDELTRGAFQEVDYTQFFGRMAKGVFEVTDPAKMGEIVSRAFHLASSGVRGPVIISVPEDLLTEEIEKHAPRPYPVASPHHSPRDVETMQEAIALAERPIVLAGGLLRGERGSSALARFAEAQRLPVATTYKNQDVFDNRSGLYAGHIGFGAPLAHRKILMQADLILAVGTRLGDVSTLNYSFPTAPSPTVKVVHVYPDTQPVGRVFRTDLGIIADPVSLLEDLSQRPRVVSSAREAWITSVNSFVREFMTFKSAEPKDGVDFGSVVQAVAELAPKDCVITHDAGNATTWSHRYWAMSPKNLLLGAIGGTMGYGVPAAVAAGLIFPHRTIITFIGDGGILMTGQELATAIQHGAKIKIVLSDNNSYGTIRTHQEREFPGRVSGTKLNGPDFAAWAQSFGAHAVRIEKGDDIRGKVQEALEHDGCSVIHVRSSLEAISAFTSLSALKPKG